MNNKKAIESGFPIDLVSEIANRESFKKEVYNPLSYIHKWWAKRLGSVFRAIILGAILDVDCKITEELFNKNNFKDTIVYDPFMGSGTTVFEALKLGCRTIGRDINPVPFTMVNAAIQDYSLDEVEKIYINLEESVKDQIQKYYTFEFDDGKKGTVLYYFWIKIVECPHCNSEIELFKSRVFSKNAVPKKDSTARSICPNCKSINHIQYNDKIVHCDNCEFKYNPQEGVVDNGKVTCCTCNTQFKLVDIVRGSERILKDKMYAKMVINEDGSKSYLPINEYDTALYLEAQEELKKYVHLVPSEEIKDGYNTKQVLNYNYKYWYQMFNSRQLLAHCLLVDQISKISDVRLKQLFTCLFSGMLEFNNMFASFKGEGTGAVRHMFYNHILKPELMPLEGNVWGTPKSSGAFSTLYKSRILKAMEYKNEPFQLKLIKKGEKLESTKIKKINQKINQKVVYHFNDFINKESTYISVGDSSKTDIPNKYVDIIVTDPPFFDNVHYSELADFFYVWMKKLLNDNIGMNVISTRFKEEVQDTEASSFSKKLSDVFKECHRVLKNDGMLVFTYHHSKLEGWTSLYSAIRNSGFYITHTQPIKAEFSNSVSIQKANIPINLDLIIICRKIEKVSSDVSEYELIHKVQNEGNIKIGKLLETSIKLTSGDKMIILMGCLLSQLSAFNDLDKEIEIIHKYEEDLELFSRKEIKLN